LEELEELMEELEELAEVATEEEVVVEVPTEGEGVVLTEDEEEEVPVLTEDEEEEVPELEEDYSYEEDEMPELEDVDVSTAEEEAAVDVTGPVEEEVRALLAAEGAAAAGHALRRMEALLGRWGRAALETPPRGVVTPPRGVVTPPRGEVTPPRGEGAELGNEMVLDTTIDLTDSPNTNQGASPLPSGPLASLTCPVCLDTLAAVTRRGGRVVSTRCGHVFCGTCLPRCIQTTGQCPTCRTRLTLFGGFHPLYLALN